MFTLLQIGPKFLVHGPLFKMALNCTFCEVKSIKLF